MKLEGANAVVVGMARSGVAAADLLRSKGAQVRTVDQNPVPVVNSRNDHGFTVEPQTAAALKGADLIVLSPGVPADLDIVAEQRHKGVKVIGDLELASWFLRGEIIGITGSNGKTTTTALTGHILQSSGIPAQVGGNIGTPPASMVQTSEDGQWNVLELSSFQLETTDTFRAHIGAALNVTPDHLDRHHTFERYTAAKGRLFANQGKGDFAVLNFDDDTCRNVLFFAGGGAPIWFSATRPDVAFAFLRDGQIFLDQVPLMPVAEIPLRGLHNAENTMAAAAIAHFAGATHAQIREAVSTFPGVEHRLEFVRELGGVAWYNDSKATNVDATLKAIAAFDGGLWMILGGKDKDSDYTALAEPLRKKARGILLIGAAAGKIKAQLQQAGLSRADVPITMAYTMDAAVEVACARAKRGETVLLAPACASFDQFENFEHRGREFKRMVKEL
jgi:UDP-N-acetylmuramoylalanine--D-glutamate ligase